MSNNGRVNLYNPDTNTLFSMYDKISCSTNVTEYRDALNGNFSENPVSCAFFSKENIQLLQESLIKQVYIKSNKQYNIGYQCTDTLKTIMRSIYLTYSINNSNNILSQVQNLNNLVLEYSVNQIIGEATGYLKYLNDVSTLAIPISHPIRSDDKDAEKYLLDQRGHIGF